MIMAELDEKWWNSGCVVNVESTEFAEGWNVGCKRKREVEDDAKVFSLSNWKDSISITTQDRWKMRIPLVFNKEVTEDLHKSSS